MIEKSIKQRNRVSISVSLGLGLGLILGLWLVLGLVLGLVLSLMPSSDIVLKSTVLSSSCVPILSYYNATEVCLSIDFKQKPAKG